MYCDYRRNVMYGLRRSDVVPSGTVMFAARMPQSDFL